MTTEQNKQIDFIKRQIGNEILVNELIALITKTKKKKDPKVKPSKEELSDQTKLKLNLVDIKEYLHPILEKRLEHYELDPKGFKISLIKIRKK